MRVELRERSEILTLAGNLASPIPRVGISVRARKLRLDDSILATSRSLGGPAPLEIEIDVKRLALSHGAEISASGFGGGGTIGITARDRVRITDSTLASAGDSRGRGGRISMSGSPAVLLERSQIDVSGSAGGGEVALGLPEARLGSVVLRSSAVDASSDQADGGSIAIYTKAFVASSDSSLNVTGATGDGTVSIDTRPHRR